MPSLTLDAFKTAATSSVMSMSSNWVLVSSLISSVWVIFKFFFEFHYPADGDDRDHGDRNRVNKKRQDALPLFRQKLIDEGFYGLVPGQSRNQAESRANHRQTLCHDFTFHFYFSRETVSLYK